MDIHEEIVAIAVERLVRLLLDEEDDVLQLAIRALVPSTAAVAEPGLELEVGSAEPKSTAPPIVAPVVGLYDAGACVGFGVLSTSSTKFTERTRLRCTTARQAAASARSAAGVYCSWKF